MWLECLGLRFTTYTGRDQLASVERGLTCPFTQWVDVESECVRYEFLQVVELDR